MSSLPAIHLATLLDMAAEPNTTTHCATNIPQTQYVVLFFKCHVFQIVTLLQCILILMLPTNAVVKSGKDGRLILPAENLPAWLEPAGTALFLVPLSWKRDINLPSHHSLEAWYAWSGLNSSEDDTWRINPFPVYQSEIPQGNDFYLRQLIYDAKIDVDTRSHRLSSPRLLRDLNRRSDFGLWILAEPNSISIWTDFAFQTSMSYLGSE